MDKEVQEIMGCTCLRMRQATRLVTQLYDHLLQPTGLTANQFGLMGHLYGANLQHAPGLSIGELAERLGMDPTTLNRNLKPLETKGWVKNLSDPGDGRVRLVRITDKGQRTLQKAIPCWREAQAHMQKALGSQQLGDLNALLDRSAAQLAHS